MFFVYASAIVASAYFCATRCMPATARRALSRVVSDAAVFAVLTIARVARYLGAIRSGYIWETRRSLPCVLSKILDFVFVVDAQEARVDTSHGHASIQLLTAILTVHGCDYDVSEVINDMWTYGNGLRIQVPVNVVLEYLCFKSLDDGTNVVIRVAYRGHGNKKRKYSAEIFSARYACKVSEVFRFPPYASSEEVKRGLGAPRIIRANFQRENERMLYGPESAQSAGLRRNFYEDVTDDHCLEKKVVTFFKPFARFQERQKIVVTTTKSNILCNES